MPPMNMEPLSESPLIYLLTHTGCCMDATGIVSIEMHVSSRCLLAAQVLGFRAA